MDKKLREKMKFKAEVVNLIKKWKKDYS